MRFFDKNKKIIIPKDNLNIKGKDYFLKSAIFHYGKRNFGHYTSINKRNNRWYYCNDTTVREVDNFDLDNAYVLLFEKCTTTEPLDTTISSSSDSSSNSSSESVSNES